MKRIHCFKLLSYFLLLIPFNQSKASDIVEVSVLTDQILLIRFDDGKVIYPNELQVDYLDVKKAEKIENYDLTSTDDNHFQDGLSPYQIYRKSKATEFIKDPIWNNAKNSHDPTSKPWASEHMIYLHFKKPMINGKKYSLNTGKLAKNGENWAFTYDIQTMRSEAIHVNTIGYASNAPKYGYVYQWMGSGGSLDLSSYEGKRFWVYKTGTTNAVKQGIIKKRKSANNPETDKVEDTPNSNFLGAEVYDCDFSDIKSDGTYYLVVEGFGCSYPFKIGKNAVFEAYYKTMRGLYYQRSGIRLAPPYTDNGYVRPVNQNTKITSDDGTSFAGKLLYSDYFYNDWQDGNGGGTSIEAIRNASQNKPLEVAGWYHDAGDWDSYEHHHFIPFWLMFTYESSPEKFADAELNIPESGNGIPDIIDEASWLIKLNYRLRKELINKGYSNGGVGGSRICNDIFRDIDRDANGNKYEGSFPSWKEGARTVVTKADAFMTYIYCSQSAQFATILTKLGKNPLKFPVEMLDHVDFSKMTYDTVDWIKEAKEAYDWASQPTNQPLNKNNYDNEIWVFRMHAAANLYRLTNDEKYHNDFKVEIAKVQPGRLSKHLQFAVYSYIMSNNHNIDQELKSKLKEQAILTALESGVYSAEKRACRWGGIWDFPMLIGHGTTPWMFENIFAYYLTLDKKFYDVVHTTADYFLGTNASHSTWTTGLGQRAVLGFQLDTRYSNNWINTPGIVIYGQWGYHRNDRPVTYVIEGDSIIGGSGTWDKNWGDFAMYPKRANWPGHESAHSNIHSPMSTEFTVHQNIVHAGLTYGFVNDNQHTNNGSAQKVTSITLDSATLYFNTKGQSKKIIAKIDNNKATFSQLKWKSSDEKIAHVNEIGIVTSISPGNCIISCMTIDGSVVTECNITCQWPEVSVQKINCEQDTVKLNIGQVFKVQVQLEPDSATNFFFNWTSRNSNIAIIDPFSNIHALQIGKTYLVASTYNSQKSDSVLVIVEPYKRKIIADFDSIVPVLDFPNPYKSQLYTPNGSNNIDFTNPLPNSSNPSNKVVKWERPTGDYRLIGLILDTLNYPLLSEYESFQFKYFGQGIKNITLDLIYQNGQKTTITSNTNGENAWKLFSTTNFTKSLNLKQFNIFVNITGNGTDGSLICYFDDFELTTEKQTEIVGLQIDPVYLELKTAEIDTIHLNKPDINYTWVSSDSKIATIDEKGIVKAIAKGNALLKAVPLFGEVLTCEIVVDGGIQSDDYESKTILDFETIKLDYSGGYGQYSYNPANSAKIENPSKTETNKSEYSYVWKRDGSSKYGGFAIILPSVHTTGWSKLSYQIYPTKNINYNNLKLYDGNTALNLTESNQLFPANQWSSITINLSDAGWSDKNFTKIEMQPAGGSNDAVDVYIDNLILEKGKKEIPSTSIQFLTQDPFSLEMETNSFVQYIVLPQNSIEPTLKWTSSDTTIAKVNGSGTIKTKKNGIVIIKASSLDGLIKDSLTLVVNKKSIPVTSVTIKTPSKSIIQIGETIDLDANIFPEDATNKKLIWTSTSTNIASVDTNGLVRGIAPGTFTITAETQDGKFQAKTVLRVEDKLYNLIKLPITCKLYPNPIVEGLLNIEIIGINDNLISVSIVNVFGQTIYENEHLYFDKPIQVKTNQISHGNYIVKLRSKNFLFQEKIQIEK